MSKAGEPEYHMTRVETRHWAADDDYEVVETQVFNLPRSTPVRVTVTPVSEEEFQRYLSAKIDAAGNERK